MAPNEALRSGDANAFTAVYEQLRTPIFSFLLRLTNDRAVAEELLQETFLRLARSASRLRQDSNLKAWLFTVARNLARDHLRRSRLDFERLRDLALWPSEPEPSASRSALAVVEARDTTHRVERAIATLKPKYREVLLLVAVAGLEPAEAAQVLGIRPTTLRQRLARARRQLTATLGNDQGSRR